MASQLLRLRRCPERLQRRLVAELVEGDARLAWLGRDLVGLAPPDWSSAGLGAATFCVVDLETTGGSPGLSKVTEIGAVRVRAGEVVDRFVTLVNPHRPIPPVVTELTGIDDDMVSQSPDIEDALAAFVDFAGQDVLVAHNAPFDLRFLNYERRRLASRYFTQPWLDTLVLARRLLDGKVERHDLRTLAGWADTSVQPIHRALPDAEATAEVLVVLLGLLADRGVDTLERAVAFAGTNGARHAHKLAARRGPARAPRRLRHARPPGPAAVRRQGRRPAPPGALVLRAGRPPRAPHRPRARAARLHRPRGLRIRVRGPPARARPHQGARAPVQPARRGRGRPLPQDRRRGDRAPGSTSSPGPSATGARTSAPCAPSAWRGRRSPSCTRSTRSARRTRPPPPPRPPRWSSCSGATRGRSAASASASARRSPTAVSSSGRRAATARPPPS